MDKALLFKYMSMTYKQLTKLMMVCEQEDETGELFKSLKILVCGFNVWNEEVYKQLDIDTSLY